jgi:histidinol-phosphate/aromatic aminotransferase/cobyric acid decarboxylase-like protein/ribosomal protein S18 acetylase RimI-like enzyme
MWKEHPHNIVPTMYLIMLITTVMKYIEYLKPRDGTFPALYSWLGQWSTAWILTQYRTRAIEGVAALGMLCGYGWLTIYYENVHVYVYILTCFLTTVCHYALFPKTTTTSIAEDIVIRYARPTDLYHVFKLRHHVYAEELGQYSDNHHGILEDSWDTQRKSVYIVAETSLTKVLAGFVILTPPPGPYSLEKHMTINDDLKGHIGYEIRTLTVAKSFRGHGIGKALAVAAAKHIQQQQDIMNFTAMGRKELLSWYINRFHMKGTGIQLQIGHVQYEVVYGSLKDTQIHEAIQHYTWPSWVQYTCHTQFLRHINNDNDSSSCYHGGAGLMQRLGHHYQHLGAQQKNHTTIISDVLDAWFPPCPGAILKVQDHLQELMRISPHAQAQGVLKALADNRTIPEESLVLGAGSSDLIYLWFLHTVQPHHKVLLFSPSYPEYEHITQKVIGCTTIVKTLRPPSFDIPLDELEMALTTGVYDLVVIVNPNSPTGQHIDGCILEKLLEKKAPSTQVWIDETYSEYVDDGQHTVEHVAAKNTGIVVVKSLSKIYGLSGCRIGYMVLHPHMASIMREKSRPWALSTIAQIALLEALKDQTYYRVMWDQTQNIRSCMYEKLCQAGISVVQSSCNFLMLPFYDTDDDNETGGAMAITISNILQKKNVFVRPYVFHEGKYGALRLTVLPYSESMDLVDVVSATIIEHSKKNRCGKKKNNI